MISEDDIEDVIDTDMEMIERVLTDLDKEDYIEVYRGQMKGFYDLITTYILTEDDPNLYYSDLFASGVIARCQNLTRGVLLGIEDKNRYLVPQCMRSLMETVALVNYVKKNPDYLEDSITGSFDENDLTNILTMMDHLDKRFEGVRDEYDDLSNHIHPNPESLMMNASSTDSEEGEEYTFEVGFRAGSFSNDEIDNALTDLRNMNNEIMRLLKPIVTSQSKASQN